MLQWTRLLRLVRQRAGANKLHGVRPIDGEQLGAPGTLISGIVLSVLILDGKQLMLTGRTEKVVHATGSCHAGQTHQAYIACTAWTDGWTDGPTDGRTDVRTDGRMDGRTDGRTDRQTDRRWSVQC